LGTPVKTLPEKGLPREEVLARMEAARSGDANWREGRTWRLVYSAGGEVAGILKEAYTMFFSENALNPMAFPSLKRFEAEVVAMTAALLGGDDRTVGNMTSAGSESILMAVKTARDWARFERPEITEPEMVLPETAHPAFLKTAHYFGVRAVRTPVTAGWRADPEAMRRAVTDDTILLVGSAPAYPQGTVDPIPEIAALAAERGILCHVDSCLGGFILPFIRRLGYRVPDFDLSEPGSPPSRPTCTSTGSRPRAPRSSSTATPVSAVTSTSPSPTGAAGSTPLRPWPAPGPAGPSPPPGRS